MTTQNGMDEEGDAQLFISGIRQKKSSYPLQYPERKSLISSTMHLWNIMDRKQDTLQEVIGIHFRKVIRILLQQMK